jgi:hypothetical protein
MAFNTAKFIQKAKRKRKFEITISSSHMITVNILRSIPTAFQFTEKIQICFFYMCLVKE